MPNTPTMASTSASAGKGHHHHGSEAVTRRRFPRDVFERHHASDADELILVDPADRRPHRRRERRRASRFWSPRQVNVVDES